MTDRLPTRTRSPTLPIAHSLGPKAPAAPPPTPPLAGPWSVRFGRRWWLGVGLVGFVVIVHGCVGREIATGMATRAAPPAPRIDVAFVRQMELTAAPPPAARPAAPAEEARAPAPSAPRPRRRPRPAKAASAPQTGVAATEAAASAAEAAATAAAVAAAAASAAAVAEAASASTVDPLRVAAAPPAADAASALAPSGSASSTGPGEAASGSSPLAAASAASDAALAAFQWPGSTRVSYLLTGNYRGEVSGSAKVEWIRIGAHYQVHLDMVVGPSFAPVITRRMTSDGEITAAGLAPRRYDQETRVMGIDRAPVSLRFEPDGGVVLANGNRVDGRAGLQDTASQFIQLSYVFGTRPELLRIGGTIDIPLALPHKVDVWTYDVAAEETLASPIGPLAAIHLTPRKKSDRVDELTAEIWFAPQLRYLPVRIRIQQGESAYIDLMIDRRPDLAGS